MLEINTLVQHSPYLGLFLLLFLGTLGLPFPEDGILLLTGVLAARDDIKPLPAFFVVYSGLLMTDFFLYSVGKKYGRKLLEHKRFQKILTGDRLIKFEGKFKRGGVLVVFFGRHLLGLRAQIFLVAGVLKMNWEKFLLADGISALLTITFWGGLGYVGGNQIQALRGDIANIEQIIMITLVALVGSVVFLRYLKRRRDDLRNFFSGGPMSRNNIR